MKCYIRCDGSAVIGRGHVIRMLALARELMNTSYQPIFIMRGLSTTILNLVRSCGFEVIEIENNQDTFEIDFDIEYNFFLNLRVSLKDILVVDHYGYNPEMLVEIKKIFGYLVLIDDFQPQRCIPEVNMVVNPSYSGNILNYVRNEGQILLLGPHYALLREQFQKVSMPFKVRRKCKNILICFGGSDTSCFTLPMLRLFDQIDGLYTITIVTGAENPLYPSLVDEVEKSSHTVILACNIENMVETLLAQDLLILSSSTVALEATSLSIPTVAISCEENQILVGQAMQESGVVCYLGSYENIDWMENRKKIAQLLNSEEDRRRLSEMAREAVNVRGAKEVVSVMLKNISQN